MSTSEQPSSPMSDFVIHSHSSAPLSPHPHSALSPPLARLSNNRTASHLLPSRADWAHLRCGLSPAFCVSDPLPFAAFLQTLSVPSPPPQLQRLPAPGFNPSVLPIAISYPCANADRAAAPAIVAEVREVIVSQVPALAAHLGFHSFQVWLDVLLLARQPPLPPAELWRRRVLPFLALPVLRVPTTSAVAVSAAQAPAPAPVAPFGEVLETTAAALGVSMFSAVAPMPEGTSTAMMLKPEATTSQDQWRNSSPSSSISSTSSSSSSSNLNLNNLGVSNAPEFIAWPGEPSTEPLETRFRTFLFAMLATRALRQPGVPPGERALCEAAGRAAFDHPARLVVLVPPRSALLPDRIRWTSAPTWAGEWEWIRPFRAPSASDLSSASGTSRTLSRAIEPFRTVPVPEAVAYWSGAREQRGMGEDDDCISHAASEDIAVRRLVVEEHDGRYDWIIFCKDGTDASVALAVVLHDMRVLRTCVFAVDDPFDFLNLTHEIETTLENSALCTAVDDLMREFRLFEADEKVIDAQLMQLGDKRLIEALRNCDDGDDEVLSDVE